jgi:FG-GAP-like repeat/Divergent InlB B-repeat domain/NHL repeat
VLERLMFKNLRVLHCRKHGVGFDDPSWCCWAWLYAAISVCLASSLALGVAAPAAAQIVTTIAGQGVKDDGPFSVSKLSFPHGLAKDAAGNLYVADMGNHRIRKVTTDGQVSTIAGVGVPGESGLGGPAVAAHINAPESIAVDGAGNVYFTEQSRRWIKKVAPNGTLSRFAGTGEFGLSGDGGAAVLARMSEPGQLLIDPQGNLLFTDTGNNRVRKISPSGVITNVAGIGGFNFFGDGGPATAASLFLPRGLALDGAGNLYIGDLFNYRIRRVGTDGIINTVAGNGTQAHSGDGGAATAASIDFVLSLGVDSLGRILIAESGSGSTIRRFLPGGNIETVAGVPGVTSILNQPSAAASTPLAYPHAPIGEAGGGFLFANTSANTVRRVDAAGQMTMLNGLPPEPVVYEGRPATESSGLSFAYMAYDSAGNLYFSDSVKHVIRKISAAGILTTIAGTGVSAAGGEATPAIQTPITNPRAIAVDAAGNVFFVERNAHRIRRIASNGTISTIAGTGAEGASFLSGPSPGDGGPATSAPLYQPNDIALDVNGNLYIADGNFRVRKVDQLGVISTIAGSTYGFSGDGGPATSARFSSISSLAVDSAGNLYLMDQQNFRLRKVDLTGTVSTIAGTGTNASAGNNGPAASASFSYVSLIRLSGNGRLLVLDDFGTKVRQMTEGGNIELVNISGYVQALAVHPGGDLVYSNFATANRVWLNGYGGPSVRVSLSTDGLADYSSTPAGLSCPLGQTRCTGLFPAGTRLQITSATSQGWFSIAGRLFCNPPAGGGANACEFDVDRDFEVVARQSSVTQTNIAVQVAGSGSGQVEGCTAACNLEEYGSASETRTLHATPAPGSEFVGWSGAPCLEGNAYPACTLTYGVNYSVTATFAAAVSAILSPNDLNDDGKSDLLWRNGGDGSVQGWLMNGLSATQVAGLLPAGGYTVTHVADLDGNGKADTLVRHTDGTSIGWLHDGLNVVGQTTFFAAGSGWSIKHTADLNGDGKADLIVEHTDGRVVGWLMNGLTVTGTATFVPAGTGWSVSRVGDLNGDGKADLIWQNSNGTVQAWLMDGLSATQTATFVGAGAGWSVKLTADFNGDGKFDLMWQNADGTVQAWLMDGTAITQIASFVPAGTGWSPVLAGDIDGDGKADLFWEHTDGRSQTWLMNGLTVTSLAGFVGAGGWKATHLFDLNGDGKKDVLWKHTDGTVQAWLMTGLTISQIASLAGAGSYEVVPPRQ